MKQTKQKPTTATLKVSRSVKTKVEKAIAGTDYSLMSFYDEAASEKLKKLKP